MKTGIVRRIDELGRIVIPKEIRKTLRIREGDYLEILSEEDKVALKRYSAVGESEKIAGYLALSCKEMLGNGCFVSDLDKVIASSIGKNETLVGERISKELSDGLVKRRRLKYYDKLPERKIELLESGRHFGDYVVVPVTKNGDLYGSIGIFSDEGKQLNENAETIASFMAGVMAESI